jgi:hypothetical protein
VISLSNRNRNARIRNHLDKEDGSHGSKTESAVDCAEGVRSAGLVVAAGRVSGAVASCARVFDLTTAEVLSANNLLALEGLVNVTVLGDVAGRLQVEGTLDKVELGGLDTVTC